MHCINPRILRHVAGAGLGIVGAFALAFLFLKGTRGTGFLRLQLAASHAPGMPTPGPAPHGDWLAAAELGAAAAIAGTLAGASRISPVAPLIAGLPFLAIKMYFLSSVEAQLGVLRHAPATLMPAAQEAIFSGVFLLLGGALAVSAAMPWRWLARPPRAHGPNWHAFGVLSGLAAIPVLWYVLQVDEATTSVVGPPARLHFPGEFWILMLTGAAILGLLASTRWSSPVAAVITGAPLFLVGVFTMLAPGAAQTVIDKLIADYRWQLSTESLAASGWLVMFGGILLAAASMPWRWRRNQPDTPDKFCLPRAIPHDTTLE